MKIIKIKLDPTFIKLLLWLSGWYIIYFVKNMNSILEFNQGFKGVYFDECGFMNQSNNNYNYLKVIRVD